MSISAIVLTRNEALNIKGCLETLSWADEVLVVDSGSSDNTFALASSQGARVLNHPFTDFSTQRNFAMSQAMGDWVLFIDADERVTPELAQEIRGVLNDAIPPMAYAIPRHTYFFGRRLRFGDARHDAPIRLFPRSAVRWEQPVHEKITTKLPIAKLRSAISHYSTRDLGHYRLKVQAYIPHEVSIMRTRGIRPNRFIAFAAAPAKLLQLYFFKLGILDGVAGLQYAILSSYYTFEKHWRYWKQHKA